MPILAILYTGTGRTILAILYHKAQRGLVRVMQGDSFASKPGEIMEVAMWLCALLLVGPSNLGMF